MISFDFYSSWNGDYRVVGYFKEGDVKYRFYQDTSENFVAKLRASIAEYAKKVGVETVPEMCKLDLDTSQPLSLSSAQDFKEALYAKYQYSPQQSNEHIV